MSMSQSSSNATKLSTGPTAFGSVSFAPGIGAPASSASSSTWLWAALGGLAAVVALLLFRKKSS